MNKFRTVLFADASIFINSISEPDKGKITSALSMMEDDIEIVRIKTLRTPTKELIVKKSTTILYKREYSLFYQWVYKENSKNPQV